MEILITEDSGRVVCKITGEITVYEAQDLKDQLLEFMDKGNVLFIDLSEVDECDTAGIQVLYSAVKTASHRDKELGFSEMSEAFIKSIHRIGLDEDSFKHMDHEE